MPELVPIRYGRMLVSPFTFYRGAALIMAADLAGEPRTGITAQLCGDAHLSNFGVFGSPERRLVFDINDFDETLPGPWEWDVKRLAVSLEVAGRDNGYAEGDRREAVRQTVAGYRDAMRQFAGMRNLEVWYANLDIEAADRATCAAWRRRRWSRGRRSSSPRRARATACPRSRSSRTPSTTSRGSSPDPPLIDPIENLAGRVDVDELYASLRTHPAQLSAHAPGRSPELLEQYRLVHVARKVVGVGSVGTRAWIALLVGRDNADPLFLQLKEARPRSSRPSWQERVPQQRRARRRRPAADAGVERHLPRLDARHAGWTAGAATSTAAS